jgi:hypothetical protein
MKHLEDEDLGRLIEGNVSPEERAGFLEHMARCQRCQTVYSETMKFNREEEHIIPLARKVRVSRRVWLAAAAMVIVALLGIFFLVLGPGEGAKGEKLELLALRYEQWRHTDHIGFGTDNKRVYVAVRLGIFREDLSLVIKSGDTGLKNTIRKLLAAQLKLLAGEGHPLLLEVENINGENVTRLERGIRRLMEEKELSQWFGFGGFLERGVLESFDNRIPPAGDISKYRDMALNRGLPQGVTDNLETLGTVTDAAVYRELCLKIRTIFFD